MKCTNATWELRNLGVKTIEIEIEKTDAPEKILDTIENYRLQVDNTFVSSNNLDVLRLHLMLGRTVTSIRNVFVKHYD